MRLVLAIILVSVSLFNPIASRADDDPLDAAVSTMDEGVKTFELGTTSDDPGLTSIGITVIAVGAAVFAVVTTSNNGGHRRHLTIRRDGLFEMKKELATNDTDHQIKNFFQEVIKTRKSPQELKHEYSVGRDKPYSARFLRAFRAALNGEDYSG